MTALIENAAFERSEELASRVLELCEDMDIPHDNLAQAVTSLLVTLVDQPNTVFETMPAYRRDVPGVPVAEPAAPIASSHSFFDVIKARASRRDFGTAELDLGRLMAILAWTFGRRGSEIAYDFRDAPLRYIPSAGGLASTDGYVIVNTVAGLSPGSYYYDYERGLIPLVHGHMAQRVAELVPGSEWISRASVVVICVVDTGRVSHKYGKMAGKLAMLDAGVALGHLELVANALELRATMLGGLPASDIAHLLDLPDASLVPIAGLAVGTREGLHA